MDERQTPATLWGPLFKRVQESAVLIDGKAFVDAVPKRSIEMILADYAALAEGDDALKHFLDANFDIPPMVEALIPFAPTLPLRDHIRAMWPQLARQPVTFKPGSSALVVSHSHVVPGGRFREMYYWDSYFTMLGLVRDGQHVLAEGIVDTMTDLIEEHGYVPNGTRSYYLGRSQPPLYYLMVGLLNDPRPAVAKRRLSAMRREHSWWMAGAADLLPGTQNARCIRLADGSLLNRYWDCHPTPREESWNEDVKTARRSGRPLETVYRDLRAGAESGWDFSSRWLEDGKLTSIRTTMIVPVDLNSFLYGLECAIAASPDSDAPTYGELAERRRAAMSLHLWSDALGHFADYDLEATSVRSNATAAALSPLFVGLADARQAKLTARFSRGKLLAPGGLRTTLVASGEQWDQPNGWAPLQWIAVMGLRRYGHTALAKDISERWLATVATHFRDTGLLYEKYDMESAGTARGGEYAPQIGFGWTNGVTAALIDQEDTSPCQTHCFPQSRSGSDQPSPSIESRL